MSRIRGYDPYPRRQRERPDAGAVVFVVCVIGLVLSLVLLALIGTRERQAEELPDEAPVTAKVTHDSLAPTYTYDGEIIRTYVFTDPDTGVEYLVNDRGGCTPRLDGHGDVMGVTDDAA